MPIASVSLGSFAVAVVALFSAGVQLFFALRIPAYRWGAWAFGVGLATAVYAFSVFLQYNAEALETHLLLERFQLSSVIWLVVSLLGFVDGLLQRKGGALSAGPIATGIAATIVVFASPGVVEPRLLSRRFFVSGIVYLEPALGPLGVLVFVLSTLAAIFVLLRLLRGLSFRGRGRRIVVAGIGIWLVTAINDLIGTLSVPVPHFLMEYGFLCFLVALLSLVMSEHLHLHQVVLRQHRQIRKSRTILARLVDERTKELRKEVADHLRTEESLRQSMADREVLIREIHHRGKNNLQIISSLLRLAFEGITVPDVARIVQESQDRIDAMAMVHEQLYGSEALSEVDFADYLRGLTSHLSGVYGRSEYEVEIEFQAEPLRLPIDRAVPLGLWANEAITNSFRHAFGPGRRGTLTVRLERLGREARLTVGDNGPGVNREHEIVQGPTGGAEGRLHLGAYLIHDLPKQIGGRLEVRSDSGLQLTVDFPLS